MRPDDSLEERQKHVVTSKLHYVNKIIYLQFLFDSLFYPYKCESKFHAHTKQQAELQFCIYRKETAL